MAAPTTVTTSWNKTPLVVDLNKVMTTDAADGDLKFRNVGLGAWPMAFPSLDNQGLFSGSVTPDATSFTLGIERPEFPVEQPMTILAAAWMFGSLFQSAVYSGSNIITCSKPTTPKCSLFSVVQAGQDVADAETGVFEVKGCVAKKVSMSLAPVGSDGGKVSLSADFAGHSMRRVDSLLTPITTTDAEVPYQTKECAISIGGITTNIVSGSLAYENNLQMDPSIAGTPSYAVISDAGISGGGEVSVVFDPKTGAPLSAWDTIWTAQKAKTAVTLLFTFTRGSITMVFTNSVLFGPGGAVSSQGGVSVQSFPFTMVGSPTVVITGVGATNPLLDWA